MWEFGYAVGTLGGKLKEEIMNTAAAQLHSIHLFSLLRISHLVSEAQKTIPTSRNAILISVQ